jgi:TRAP-type C4-dicarboxylate transport system permease small subunit
MVKIIFRGAHALTAVIRVVAGALLISSVAVNFANIIGRYFLSASIPWAEEVMLFLMVGCVFLGSGLVGWSGRQIRMDAVVSLLPLRLRAVIELVSDLVLIASCVVLAVLAWPVVAMLTEFDQRSQAANVPLALPQATLPVGFLILAFLVAVRVLTRTRNDTPTDAYSDH